MLIFIIQIEIENNFCAFLKDRIKNAVKNFLKKYTDKLIDCLLDSDDSKCKKFDLLNEFLRQPLKDIVLDILTFEVKVNQAKIKNFYLGFNFRHKKKYPKFA